jgi:Cu-processing system permease protein
MGYTGAFYKDFFGSSLGLTFASSILILWIGWPLWLAMRIFSRMDL